MICFLSEEGHAKIVHLGVVIVAPMQGDKRVVEIDGEHYVIDLEKHSVNKLDVSVTTESGK
ncbi:MAG: hypothetical protein HYR83_07420 [Planctomycetes bacterium]|nr:hypothetical protein [Planctomycetota bacterium]